MPQWMTADRFANCLQGGSSPLVYQLETFPDSLLIYALEMTTPQVTQKGTRALCPSS